MNEIGNEYGQALFLLAVEEEALKEFDNAFSLIQQAFLENEGYLSFLSSPHIPREERCAALDGAFGEALPKTVVNFLKLLLEKGRLAFFEKAVEEYRRLFFLREKLQKAKITSAKALTKEEKENILSKLEKVMGGGIQAEYTIDPAILGGIKVEIDGKILDGSIKARLREAKEVMTR